MVDLLFMALALHLPSFFVKLAMIFSHWSRIDPNEKS
jgi:hypothetical protein